MPLLQENHNTDVDYFSLPENVRAEQINGKLIYNQAAPSRIHQMILGEVFSFQDKIKVNIYEDLWICFDELGL